MTNRQGFKQLAVWITDAAMTRLDELATQTNQRKAALIEAAITAYLPDPPDDRLAQLEARVAALESRLALPGETLDSVIAELAERGFTPTAIADELNRRGYRTSTGNPFTRGHSAIARIQKLKPPPPSLI